MQYSDPIGAQFRVDFYNKKALIEAKKKQFFGQLADTISMPKNMGKKIVQYIYLPLLDDANINDQGIDANGASTVMSATIGISRPDEAEDNQYTTEYVMREGANAAAAIAATNAAALIVVGQMSGLDITVSANDSITKVKAILEARDPAWVIDTTEAQTATVVPESGNLYGSSKDVGTIAAKMPALSETGGRVNRVGFTRKQIEGNLEKFGFFDEYTKESLDFDTDAELDMHVTREMVLGASEMTEDALQIDLLNAAGVIRFGGEATTTSTLTGENGSVASLPTYGDLMRLSIDLDNNRCPKNTKIITGTRMVDTKTIDSARIMYIGNELEPMVKAMLDTFGNQAFIPVRQYGNATTLLEGEIGSIDQFRIVVVPEMMHWSAAGATVSSNDGYRETGGKYDVFPMLVVGDASFTTIGFQTDGKTVKFKIKHVKPETEQAYSRDDPYGELGFMSIKWYYGFMALRPERIALVKTVATW
jgi:N4-gp56 family major capsid protein